MVEPAFVNGFVDGSDIVLLYRTEAGELRARRRRAEWSSFHRTEQLTAAHLKNLRDSSFVLGISNEGAYTRVRWQAHEWRQLAIYGSARSDPPHTTYFKENGLAHFEADVSPIRRFFSETGAHVGLPRRLYLDIETDSRVPPVAARAGKARVLCWTLVGADERVVGRGMLEADTDDAEAALLENLWAAAEPYDQLVAWFGDEFDFPIVRKRSQLVGAKCKDFRRWLYMDHMALYERMNRNVAESGDEKASLALHRVAKEVLGYGKFEGFDGSKTYEAWLTDRARLAEYNERDTLLLPRIEKKRGHLAMNDVICEIGRLFADTRSINPIEYVDGFMLRLGVEHGIRFPTRSRRDDDEGPRKQFAGAYVMEPKTKGIAKDVHVLDFSGMYPSIIQTWNMSAETRRGDVPVNGPVPAGCCRSPSTGVGFANEPVGILPEALRELGERRKHWTNLQASLPPGSPEWHDARRRNDGYKVVRNTFYGVVGSPFSRFFDSQVAESITQNGVWLIRKTIYEAELCGMRPVYGDSLTGDRCVVLRSPTGRTIICPVEEFFARAPASAKANVGEKQVLEMKGTAWKALARDGAGKEGWYPLRCLIRHRVRKELVRISTKRGETEVTCDHSIMLKSLPVSPDEFLERGARFEKVRAQRGSPFRVLDLFEFLKDFLIAYPYKNRIVERRFFVQENWIGLSGWGVPRQFIRRYYQAGSDSMRALLRVMGAYLAEGSASLFGKTATRTMFSVAQNDVDWVTRIARDLESITSGVRVSVLWTGGGTWAARSGGALLAHAFAGLCGFGSRGKRFPAFVYDLSGDDLSELLRLMFEGDGYIEEATAQGSYTSISQQLMAGLSYVLDQRGIEHAIHYRPAKRAWTLRTRPSGAERARQRVLVSRREATGEYVYDLSVEGAHTFVDAMGRVLLHNTDSAFLADTNRDQMAVLVEHCNREIFPSAVAGVGCARNLIEIAYEKHFERIVFVSAKKYCGTLRHYKWTTNCTEACGGSVSLRTMRCEKCGIVYEDATLPPPRGKPEIKGLEYKRGDASRLAAVLQFDVIKRLMVDRDEDPERFVAPVSQMREHVLRGGLTVDEVVLSQSITRAIDSYKAKLKKDGTPSALPAHVQVAKLMKERGAQIFEGMRIEYYVVDASDAPMRVAPAADWSLEGEFDRHYLWEQRVWPPTERLLVAAFPSFNWSPYARSRPAKERAVSTETRVSAARGRAAPVGQGQLFGAK